MLTRETFQAFVDLATTLATAHEEPDVRCFARTTLAVVHALCRPDGPPGPGGGEVIDLRHYQLQRAA